MNADKKVRIADRDPVPQQPSFHVGFFDQLDIFSFRFDGKRYRMAARDQAVRRFLLQFSAYQQGSAGPVRPSLFAFRGDFRRIIAARPIAGLIWCVYQGDAEMRRIAVWLLGRIRNRRTLNAIIYWQDDGDFRVRKEIVKALWRFGAWSALREISEWDENPAVQRVAIAAQLPPEEFERRLKRFLRREVHNVGEYQPEAPRPCLIRGPAEIGGGLPPKSPHFIRMILQRIRRLVHGDKKA